ncbi:MAG TPA: ATP-binding protein, partial [Terriglobia bacterium]|nr:ATP-binding protein [Terriglobia bacterium]
IENLKRMDRGISRAGVDLLNECRDLCERSLQEVRTMSFLSHPTELEGTGLVSALRWYVEGFRKRTGISVDLQLSKGIAGLPNELEVDLFRVVQEGLFNIFRHSGSRNAVISFQADDDHVLLRIKDGGHGIPEAKSRSHKELPAGTGISSIRGRLRRWGGHVTIESSDNGAVLVADVPIHEQEKAVAVGQN